MDCNYGTRPLWFWNDLPTEESIKEIMENCSQRDGYAGFGILPYNACGLQYMSEEYLRLYGMVLREARRLHLKMCLYDEWWFPSGSAGGLLRSKYPEACAKRLDLEEYTTDSVSFRVTLPTDGTIMALVAMKDHIRVDVSPYLRNGVLCWDAPESGYKLLCFILRSAGLNRVDYLDPDAVRKFIACTHEVYYARFSEYFGDVIDSAFYDEPQFYSARGRAWTGAFNAKYMEVYGESPALYYPALWYDIGEETVKARTRMFGLRAQLYAEGFPKVIGEWCADHGIALTGHVDQEEAENPCGITGDLMLSFRYQDIPGIDQIFCEGRASEAYKIVSSAAINWNKQKVMCECFGAMDGLTEDTLWRESYDLFTKGINVMVPHAVWQNPAPQRVKFPPELSYRTPYYGEILPRYNAWCARLQRKLQTGGQVNSVAILYPIESLQYVYRFSWDGDPVSGGPTWAENNYMRLGQYLSRELNCDYTFLHPQVLNENCTAENGVLSLQNSVHYQHYRAVILPGMKVIARSAAQKLWDFVRGGGTLISVGERPAQATEPQEQDALDEILRALFGTCPDAETVRSIGKGRSIFLPYAQRARLAIILREVQPDTQVITCTPGLQYIHKRNDDGDCWYFAAIQHPVNTEVIVDGCYALTRTDPKTGIRESMAYTCADHHTHFRLVLNREESVLIEGTPV